MPKNPDKIICYFLLFINCYVFSQKQINNVIPDSLKELGYNRLYQTYKSNKENNKTIAYKYALSYLKKAKENNSKIEIVKGYHYVGALSSNEKYLKYLDSAIAKVKDRHNFVYPSKSYLFKGYVHYEDREFRKAIDNLLISNKLARKQGNSNLMFYSNYMISILTDRIGNHQDAINILKEYPKYLKDKEITKTDTTLLLNTYHALSVASYKAKKIDSSAYFNSIGISKSLKSKKKDFYNLFVLSSGVTLYGAKELSKSLDSIEKAIPFLKKMDNKPNLAVAYFYKGKILYETDRKDESIVYLKKLDTIFQIQNDVLPDIREGYELLIKYYKEKKQIKEQLIYTEKLVEVDKVLNDNYKHLQTNIIKDYYTPILISKKIDKENKVFWKIIYSVFTLLFVTFFGFIFNYYRQKKYKLKFKTLLEKQEVQKNKSNIKTNQNKLDKLKISKEIITQIIDGLHIFESEKKFLNSKYSLSILAKELKTNSSYLSKIINFTKNKNFSNYINDLRVDYAINELNSNTQFKLYSIKAISEEVGFKNTESFSKAFHKKTGLYPSYFIKQLNKK
ncbi:AraC family transcriptional regulator [Aquimarina sp. AD1]|uniref:helix-turn-helix domain-containing protein n=2 Tax=Aquimarina sp. (strain AD1) TaxID=1714848 RepID=UPI000E49DF35|nr:helix-turn-helix domain-containing protein [Aquimarina sp. AD1]AXT57438.1 AraC family transcriptional regulator [Aquimarina sp. AD1]